MLGYIQQKVQLKLFRYALSKLDFLDHSTYDVERDLNLSLGLTNELHMRNISLNVEKLSSMLALPPSVKIKNAKVSLLHIRIPSKLHKDPVKVTISGVIAEGSVHPDFASPNTQNDSDIPISSEDSHDLSDSYTQDDFKNNVFRLPSGMDLTSSFLHDRPKDAKEVEETLEEFELSKSQQLNKDSSSDDDDENDDDDDDFSDGPGLGTPLSFLDFVPSFFQGLVDRVEVDIRSVSFRMEVPYDPETASKLDDGESRFLTLRVDVESLDVEGVTSANDTADAKSKQSIQDRPGMRAVRLKDISVSLLGHTEFFEPPLQFELSNPEDTETVRSDSTILPSANFPKNKQEDPLDDLKPSTKASGLGSTVTSVPLVSEDEPSTPKIDSQYTPFFAAMQQPPRGYGNQDLGQVSTSRDSIDYRSTPSPGSIDSEDLDSRLLSQSIFLPEDQNLFHSDSNIENSDDEHLVSPFIHSNESSHPPLARGFSRSDVGSNREILADDNDDNNENDSMMGDSRRFDLYLDQNAKFLGGSNLNMGVLRATDDQSASQSQRETSEFYSPYTVTDGRNNSSGPPSLSHPQPTTVSRNPRATFLDHVDDDEYHYYEEALADSEYSNPEQLYLSQPTKSNNSSIENSVVQQVQVHDEDENELSESKILQLPVEPKVIYSTHENNDNNSDSESDYQSYPASEAEAGVDATPGDQVQNVPFATLSTSSGGDSEEKPDIRDQRLISTDNEIPSLNEPAAQSSPFPFFEDAPERDDNKVRGHAALLTIRNASQVDDDALNITDEMAPFSGEDSSVPSLSRMSSSEGSEAGLGESMLFTHEQADSLYMSALGGSGSVDPIKAPTGYPPVEDSASSKGLSSSTSDIKISKQILKIDYFNLFIPGIVSGVTPPTPQAFENSVSEDSMSESAYPTVPGAFSVYAQSRPSRKNLEIPTRMAHSAQKRSKPNVSFESKPMTTASSTSTKPSTSTTSQSFSVEIEIGTLDISLDLGVGKRAMLVLTDLLKVLNDQGVSSSNPSKSPNKSIEDRQIDGPTLKISLATMKIALLEKLPAQKASETIDDIPLASSRSFKGSGSENTSLSILTIFTSSLSLTQSHETSIGSRSSRSVTEIVMLDGGIMIGDHEIMKFTPKNDQKGEVRRKGKMKTQDKVFTFRMIKNVEETQMHIQCVPLGFYFPTRSIEDMMSYFGGFESMLSLASSSNLSTAAPKNSGSRSESSKSESTYSTSDTPKYSLSMDIAGVSIKIFVSDFIGGIGLSTSSIRIKSSDQGGLSLSIPQIAIFGPDFELTETANSASTLLSLDGISITFDNSPTDEDLEHLLGLITPSTDRYGRDDDLMIDVLLRQRRKGSVVRLDVKRVNGVMKNLQDISRFMIIAEELAKMGTVAKYIPQDERPGLLTLLHLRSLSLRISAGPELRDFVAELGGLELCHIATPSLLALAIGQISLIRTGRAVEKWIGESLPRALAILNDKDENRPMARVRMIGDEPEPEIKIKIWNTRFEYHVESLQALLSLTEKDTTDVIATNMVDSIAHLAEKEVTRRLAEPLHQSSTQPHSRNTPPLRVNIGLNAVSVGLNPLTTRGKALLIVQEGSFICQISAQDPFSATLVLHKASLVAVDDQDTLTSPQKSSTEPRHQMHETREAKRDLTGYTSQGYVSILTMTSAKLDVRLEDDDVSKEKDLSVKVSDVFIVIESCADSTQTIISILNGLKMPLPESEEIKYKTEIMPVDVFANLDENAFVPSSYVPLRNQPRNLRSLEDMPEDLLEDEIPFNSQLIESYYPSRDLSTRPNTSDPETSSSAPHFVPGFHEQVRVVAEEPLIFDEGYFPNTTKDTKETEGKIVPRRQSVKVAVRNVQLIWNLHDGYDWHKTRDTISKAVKDVEDRASKRKRPSERMAMPEEMEDEEETEIYDVLFNSIYITLPKHRDARDLSREIQHQISGDYDTQSETGSYAPTITTLDSQSPRPRHRDSQRTHIRYRRSKRNAMQFELKGVDLDLAIFAPDGLEVQSSIDVRVKDIQVTENVRTSTWRLFLTYMREAGSRENGSPMAHIHLDTLRPVPDLAATELSIKVKLLPLRLHVDQDALEFLTRFFEFKDPDALTSDAKVEEPFIQRCEIDTVRVKLDFKPKRVDYAGLRSGKTTEFMNFFILEEADMELRHVALNGVSGFERLGKDLNNIWMPDIKSNQLGGVLAGVAPVRSLVNIGTGVRDLVKVPIMEYRKDGRLVRSIKKGTQHFVKTSGSEVARLGAKLAVGTQNILERTEGFLVGETSQPRYYASHREQKFGDEDIEGNTAVFSPYANQPLGVKRGLVQARDGFARNMNEAKEAILRVPSEAAEGGSAKSAAVAILRAAPTTIIRPMIGVTEAVHNTLHGIDNTIDPEKEKKIRDKYKR